MEARLHSWWQTIKQHRVAIGVVAIVLVVAIALIIVGYQFDWTGFKGYNKVTTTTEITLSPSKITKTEEYQPGKSLWDWLQLLGILAIPAVVGLGAAWYTAQQGKVSDREHTDNQRETALQAYIDKMSELLLHEKLRDSAEEDEVWKIARVRTWTVLPRLDANRKRSVLQFLYESGLIDKGKCIVDLSKADLSRAELSGANLKKANLYDANLSEANLSEADLSEAYLRGIDLSGSNLSGANLSYANLNGAVLSNANLSGEASLFKTNLSYANLNGANLKEANLDDADLSGANLTGAQVTNEQLNKAESLQGATMPDASIHP